MIRKKKKIERFVIFYITTKDRNQAVHLGKILIEKRIAACVNIIEGMESFYWWEGKIENARECILLVKTKRSFRSKVEEEINRQHSYSVPCILSLPIATVNQKYGKWLNENLKLVF